MFIRFAKLIADVGRYTWLNSSGAEADQSQADQEHHALANGDTPCGSHACKRQIAQTVNNRQRKNGPILTEKTVGENRTENWQKINAKHEKMRVHVRLVLIHRREHTRLIQDVMRHEDGQDGLHAVIGETLRRFVADDVRHAWR